MKKIMFQGDSITDAGRDRSDAHNLAGYSLNFAKNINYRFEIVNYACSGDTSRMMVNRHFNEFKKEMPDFLILLIGINDIWRHFGNKEAYAQRVSLDEYVSNVLNTINKSLELNPKCHIIFIEPFLLEGESNLKKMGNDMYKQYISALKSKIKDLPIVYVETNDKMNKEQNNGNILSYDGVHPNEKGNIFLAKLLEEHF